MLQSSKINHLNTDLTLWPPSSPHFLDKPILNPSTVTTDGFFRICAQAAKTA